MTFIDLYLAGGYGNPASFEIPYRSNHFAEASAFVYSYASFIKPKCIIAALDS